MAKVTILREAELRAAVALDLGAIEVVEAGFRALARGGVVMPPILSMAIAEHSGEIDVKTAYVPGMDGFAVKMSPGFFDNPKIGLPSTSGLMILFAAKTGQLQALLLDNGYLTDLRTAAAGAIAARLLAREDAKTAAILGAGMQARLQLAALARVRPIERALYWGRDLEKARATAGEMAEELGIVVEAVASAREAVEAADVIVTTTPAKTPILEASWLRRGQHLTAMGSDQDDKNEIDPAVFDIADLYVPDRLSQTRVLGELRSAVAARRVAADRSFAELGEIAIGAAPGRVSPEQITFADLTGTGVQDTAIATFALERARAAQLGEAFEN